MSSRQLGAIVHHSTIEEVLERLSAVEHLDDARSSRSLQRLGTQTLSCCFEVHDEAGLEVLV
jgi:hypothetical protein